MASQEPPAGQAPVPPPSGESAPTNVESPAPPAPKTQKQIDREKLRAGLKAMFGAGPKPAAAADQQPAKKAHSDGDSSDSDSEADEGKGRSRRPQKPIPASESTLGNEEVEEGDKKRDTAVLKIDATGDTVEVVNVRLFSMEDLDFTKLTQCTTLSLRKNLIHELAPLPRELAARVVDLDFFDNKIRKIREFFTTCTEIDPSADEVPQSNEGEADGKHDFPVLKKVSLPCPYTSLLKLDLSYNQIKTISGLDSLGGTLKELYLVENRIKHISGLDQLVNLELLELGGNRLRGIGEGLQKLKKLKFLWLGKNKIVEIGPWLNELDCLELVSLQANRITKLEPENFPGNGKNPNLREIYISENNVSQIEHLENVHTLRVLDCSFDPIQVINDSVLNVTNHPHLTEFWLTDGKISDWKEVEKLKCFSETLRTVYLERNPIEEDKRYRDKIYLNLPFVTQIDSWPVVNKDNLEGDRTIYRTGA